MRKEYSPYGPHCGRRSKLLPVAPTTINTVTLLVLLCVGFAAVAVIVFLVVLSKPTQRPDDNRDLMDQFSSRDSGTATPDFPLLDGVPNPTFSFWIKGQNTDATFLTALLWRMKNETPSQMSQLVQDMLNGRVAYQGIEFSTRYDSSEDRTHVTCIFRR